ncbi:unannotated protein [freshwater metagenome]|uniref:Unannotated protein n=1 Tax=freshwater metagenome TaxID=449393 RepID=A0A6J6EYL8_9ZZZZ
MKGAPLGNLCMREPRAGVDRKALNNFVAGQGAPVMALRVSRLRVHQGSPVMSDRRWGNREWFADRRSLPLIRFRRSENQRVRCE